MQQETRLGMTYDEFVKKYLENDPYEFMAHIDAMWASLPVDAGKEINGENTVS